MRERATALAVVLGLVIAGVACSGGAEKNVVNQYFTALAANDTNTLTSFAAVAFDKEVENYKVIAIGEETRGPATSRREEDDGAGGGDCGARPGKREDGAGGCRVLSAKRGDSENISEYQRHLLCVPKGTIAGRRRP